jgi:hypothetical protein
MSPYGGQLCPPDFSCYLVRHRPQKENVMARKPADIVAVKVRMREDLRRQIEKLAKKNGQTVNGQTVLLLDSAVLAEQLGLGGVDGVIKAVQSSSAAFAVEEIIKQLGLDKPKENQFLSSERKVRK